MELGVSVLTRRDRLERIASAERDRRAGRIELAIAALGEGTEWPARVILALAKLAEDEGDETRALLVRSLDDWAAESRLDPLDPLDRPSEVEAALPENGVGDLDSPIEHDELERAFAQAEAQTDEMLDVNRVAERVLMDEPVSLAELSGDELLPMDHAAGLADEPAYEPAGGESLDARENGLEALGGSGLAEEGEPLRGAILATLEKWLVNLEDSRAGRAQ